MKPISILTIQHGLNEAVPARAPWTVSTDEHGWLWARDACGATYTESSLRVVLDKALTRKQTRPIAGDTLIGRALAEMDGAATDGGDA